MDRAGELLQHQLRGVPAAVVPDVDDQALAGDLEDEVAVQLGPAVGDHVRDVQVADPAAGQLVDVAARRPATQSW